jgi:hypothetical protein
MGACALVTLVHWIALFLVLAPLPGRADVYDRLSGTFGDPAVPEESCDSNPVFSRFAEDQRRLSFAWVHPVRSYTGAMITAFGGTIVATGPDSITLLRDNETRVTREGAKVLWVMRAIANPDGYCWTRPDLNDGTCAPLLRCQPAANS